MPPNLDPGSGLPAGDGRCQCARHTCARSPDAVGMAPAQMGAAARVQDGGDLPRMGGRAWASWHWQSSDSLALRLAASEAAAAHARPAGRQLAACQWSRDPAYQIEMAVSGQDPGSSRSRIPNGSPGGCQTLGSRVPVPGRRIQLELAHVSGRSHGSPRTCTLRPPYII